MNVISKDIGAARKEANWAAICSGRDLLEEIRTMMAVINKQVRGQVVQDILDGIVQDILDEPIEPSHKRGVGDPGFCAGDTLD